LLRSIDDALTTVGWRVRDIDGFAVTLGPGSFTGLRIGLTTIKTLAWTARKAYIGVPSLDALAAGLAYSSLPVCPLIDAHKEEMYGCLYRGDLSGEIRPLSPYGTLSVKAVAQLVQERTLFCGDGWLVYGKALKKVLGTLAVEASAPFHLIRAGVVAELARKRLERGDHDDPVVSVPLYVRPSEAELNHPHARPADLYP
jgi:tRNA threonylcarbamoyladenosine biosynthesis protein TsaB